MTKSNNELVNLIFDDRNGCAKYSKSETADIIRGELIAMNGGSDKLNVKAFRRNPEMYDLVEEIVSLAVNDDFGGGSLYDLLVDEKAIGDMDSCQWSVDTSKYFVVSDIARGTQVIRRQRIADMNSVMLTPKPHAVKFYDEFVRVMSGKVDMNAMLDKVSRSARAQRYADMYALLNSLSQTDLGANYVYTGSYDEDKILEKCDMVSAANGGSKVMLYGPQSAVRQLVTTVPSDVTKDELRLYGYPLVWNGIDVIAAPNTFIPGTETFAMDSSRMLILPVGGTDKPVKLATADGIINITDGMNNPSLQPEIFYVDNYDVGILIGDKIGLIDLT